MLFLSVSGYLQAQGSFDTRSKLKASCIQAFTTLLEWPSDYKQGEFVIGVLGDSPMYTELNKMIQTKNSVGAQPIKIKKFRSTADIGRCHILYIEGKDQAVIKSAVSKLNGKSTLIVTESPDLQNNSPGINFVVVNYRLKFILNKTKIENEKVKVSTEIERIAHNIY